ncbi:hypothetical protein HJFPF1_12996 [Paramyrothecium foliicola]|nr:hypothetical protein HJFPF1_12996 [Paramyrothecium foliicola]
MGAVIIGDTDDFLTPNKFLAHFNGVAKSMDDQWQKLVKDINTEKLSNMKSWLSLPSLETLADNIDKDDIEAVQNKLIELLTDLTGKVPTVRYHNMYDTIDQIGNTGTMQLNYADNTVEIDGNQVEFEE